MDPIFKIINLKKYFPVTKGLFRKQIGFVKALDNISFSVDKGEVLGIVGESGSGKTTLARILLRLISPSGGKVEFEGSDLFNLNKKELMNFRKRVQIVFQDPHTSLNPRLSIASTVGEGLIIHKLAKNKKDRKNRIAELLNSVGLKPDYMNRYPHEFSGGQRQRIGIARALSVNPEVIIADEPVSSLDVSVQAQILNLFVDLQEKFNLTYIFIAHDLRVVEHISTRIIVMYMGKIVETALKDELYKNPIHPYTKLLLNSIPNLDPDKRGFSGHPSLLSLPIEKEHVLKEVAPQHLVAFPI
jgi:oligopeptide transport system ATP-binding protein